LLEQELGGEAASPILMLNKNLAWISFSTFSQALKTRGRGAATVQFNQGGGGGAGVIKEVVWWSFKLIWVSYAWRW
jgi:hypothetical protein